MYIFIYIYICTYTYIPITHTHTHSYNEIMTMASHPAVTRREDAPIAYCLLPASFAHCLYTPEGAPQGNRQGNIIAL